MTDEYIDLDKLDDETVLSLILYCSEHKVPKEMFDFVMRLYVRYMEVKYPEELKEMLEKNQPDPGTTREDFYRKYLDIMDSKP